MKKIKPIGLLSDKIKKRFTNKILYGMPDGCHYWIGFRHKSGYGAIAINKSDYAAHRVAYRLYKGDVPNDLLVCHTCDNPSCVNPDHLFLGTSKDNIQDMIKKNRSGIIKKLNTDKVTFIRKSNLPHSILAKIFNVDPTTISDARKYRTWN